MRRRVIAYVTRERDGRRELHEEAGLVRARIVGEIAGPVDFDRMLPGSRYANHVFHLEPLDELPESWERTVLGDGDDAGLVFSYRLEPVREDLLLWGRRDPFLPLLS